MGSHTTDTNQALHAPGRLAETLARAAHELQLNHPSSGAIQSADAPNALALLPMGLVAEVEAFVHEAAEGAQGLLEQIGLQFIPPIIPAEISPNCHELQGAYRITDCETLLVAIDGLASGSIDRTRSTLLPILEGIERYIVLSEVTSIPQHLVFQGTDAENITTVANKLDQLGMHQWSADLRTMTEFRVQELNVTAAMRSYLSLRRHDAAVFDPLTVTASRVEQGTIDTWHNALDYLSRLATTVEVLPFANHELNELRTIATTMVDQITDDPVGIGQLTRIQSAIDSILYPIVELPE